MPPTPIPRPLTSQLSLSVPEYRRLLAVRAKQGGPPKERANLVELDEELWGLGESSITGRLSRSVKKEKVDLNLEDVKKCMTWKLANTPEVVASTTRDAFSQYAPTPAGALASLKTLCALKGIGPATASLLLSLYSPETESFMSDEALLCLDCKVGYTEKDWKGFREKVVKAVAEGKWESARDLEKGCWTWAMRVYEGEDTKDAEKSSSSLKTSSKASQAGEAVKGRGKRTSLQKESGDEGGMTEKTTKDEVVDSSVDKTKRRRTKA